MADFQNAPVSLSVTPVLQTPLAAFPRALQILVSDARQVSPTQGTPVNTVFLFAGIARFGQDTVPRPGEPGPLSDSDDGVWEDGDNRYDDSLEVDHGRPKTLYLQLGMSQFQSNSSAGSCTFTGLGNVGLQTNDRFGAETVNGLTELTATGPLAQGLPADFWLFSDVIAEENCILNRLGYQATVLLQTTSLAMPTSSETMIPHEGGIVDLDVSDPQQVASPGALDVGVVDGLQVFPGPATNGAKRLLIFTGTALCNMAAQDDNIVFRQVVRVRLQFPIPPTLIVQGSAAMAALARIHGNDDDPGLFGVNTARIVTDPTDGGPLGPTPLPQNELYLLVEISAAGVENAARPGITGFAYQANILVQDTLPDLDSILVSQHGTGMWGPVVQLTVGGADVFYDIQLTLTGPPSSGVTVNVSLDSSEPQNVLVPPLVVLSAQTTVIPNVVLGNTSGGTATITARGNYAVRTASVVIKTLT